MEDLRFLRFVLLVGEIQKNLQKVKWTNAVEFGLKGVHMVWMLELSLYPDGLSMSELAKLCMNDRALVSREISAMEQNGYITFEDSATGGRHRYSAKLKLTERGRALAKEIEAAGRQIQESVNYNVSEEDLKIFYSTLEKLQVNFQQIIEEDRGFVIRSPFIKETKQENNITEEQS